MLGIGVALCCLVPRLSVAVLVVVSLAAVFVGDTRQQLFAVMRRRDVAIALPLALFCYLLANAGWAFDPAEAYPKVATVLIVTVCAFVVVTALRSLDADVLKYAQMALAIGLAGGLAVVGIGWFSDRAGARLFYTVFPDLQPDNRKWLIVEEDGTVLSAGKWELNRNMGMLALLVWAAVLSTARAFKAVHGARFAAVFLAVSAVVIGVSHHQASQIALFASAVVFGLSMISARMVRIGLACLWCLSFLAVVPVANLSYRTFELHNVEWLPRSARARVIIWGETAGLIEIRPLLGVGIRSTRHFDMPVKNAELPQGQVYGKRTGRHAHNLYLQVWFELGAIGVVLLMASVLLLFLKSAGLAAKTQPYANAAFTMFATISAFSWGIWQSWLLAAWGMAFVAFCLAAWSASQRPSPEQPPAEQSQD